MDYSLERHIEGTMPPFTRRLGEPENYEEWEYTTSRGCTVCIGLEQRGGLAVLYL